MQYSNSKSLYYMKFLWKIIYHIRYFFYNEHPQGSNIPPVFMEPISELIDYTWSLLDLIVVYFYY